MKIYHTQHSVLDEMEQIQDKTQTSLPSGPNKCGGQNTEVAE